MPFAFIPSWIPPVFALLRLKRVWLPLPVLLLWPLLLVAWLLFGVGLVVMPRAPGMVGSRGRLRMWWRLWCVLGALRGLSIQVRTAANGVAGDKLRHVEPSARGGGRPASPARSRPTRFTLWVI